MENKKNAKPFSDGKFSVSMHLRPKSDLAWSVHNAKRKLDHTLSPLWLTPFFLSYNRNRAFCKEKSYVSPVFLLLWADNRGLPLYNGNSPINLKREAWIWENGKSRHRPKNGGVMEIALPGPQEGNPCLEHWVSAVFAGENEAVKADGFYDGDGIHRVRFMPSFEGEYTFSLQADFLPQPL